MQGVIYAVVRIEYEMDDDKFNGTMSPADEELIATGLAITPNFTTVESGINLKSVHLQHATPYEEVDWQALKYFPDQVYVKQ